MASTSRTRSLDLDRTLDEVIDWRYKSFPPGPPVKVRSVREKGWNALGGDFMLPVMLLKEPRVRRNIDERAALCARTGFSLAPHAKTSMAPQLVQRQLAAGAWAITAATTWQVRLWRELGAHRIILANELVEKASIDWVAAEMKRDADFDFYCLVDSVAAVKALDRAPGFKVLLELGLAGGRTGCRTEEQAVEVARAIKAFSHITLAGVEAFEVWGVALSMPEPGLALLGFGKRDVPYDTDLPVPRYIKRGHDAPRKFEHAASVFNTNDQHAYLRLDGAEGLQVGDLVGCGI